MDEISEPELTLKILEHQWFWSYEIFELNCCQKQHNKNCLWQQSLRQMFFALSHLGGLALYRAQNAMNTTNDFYNMVQWNYIRSGSFNFDIAMKIEAGWLNMHLDIVSGYSEQVKFIHDIHWTGS